MLSSTMTTQAKSKLGAAFEAVLEPTEKARGLPNALYTDPMSLQLERDQVFANTWTALAFASEVPNAGDVRPIQWCDWPLVMLRDEAGQIRVFHNVCSHRGRQIVEAPCHVNSGLRCPYHFWFYGLDGRLRGTPHIGGMNKHSCAGFDKSAHGLSEVNTHVWCDVVFINLSGNAPPFADFIAPLMQRWEAFWGTTGPESMIPGGSDSRIVLEVQSNWKLAVENYCESYHLPMVHPGLNSYSRLEDHYIVLDDDGESFSGQGTYTYSFAESAGISLPEIPQWPAARRRQAEYISLYPNALLGIQADHFFVVLLEPVNEHCTREHIRLYYVGEAATDPAYSSARIEQARAWDEVFKEDIAMVEGMQRGRASPAYIGGAFSPAQDRATHHFHHWIARQMRPVVSSNDTIDCPQNPEKPTGTPLP